jgi:hypothetical protein
MKAKRNACFFLLAALAICTYHANAQADFTKKASFGIGSNNVFVTAADIHGNGKMDLIVANGGVLIFTNDGNGGFGSNSTMATVLNAPSRVTAADVNGDGRLDLIWSEPGYPGHIYVFTNNGSGGFGSNAVYAVGNTPDSAVAADVNNDGYPDLICANGGSQTLSVLTNNGTGGFKLASSPATGSDGVPFGVVAADVNNDGSLDLICANRGNIVAGHTLTVLTNNGSGGFMLASTPGVGAKPGSVVAADIYGNGQMDLICANQYDNTLSVLTNNGSGGFGSNATLVVGSNPVKVIAADLGGDGRPDLVCANLSSNTLSVWTNNGSGVFGSNATMQAGTYTSDVAAADINGDGRLDLICGNNGLYSPASGRFISKGAVLIFVSVPRLTSTLSANNLLISWPSVWTNWTLLQNTDLTITNWTSFSGTVSDNGTIKTATNSSPSGNMFFRLSHP